MSRISYVMHTIQSTCWLVGSCNDGTQSDAIMQRACEMLSNVWTCEYKASKGNLALTQWFWDSVSGSFDPRIVYHFHARFGEDVNPPGDIGNVKLTFQSNPAGRLLMLRLTLNDRVQREDYELICEKYEIGV
jgi:hypothetical protein